MALVNPNIAMSYRGVEVPQQNALADYAAVQQIQSGQRQAEVSQMQIEQMRRDDATLKQIQAKSMENGGPADLDSIADAYLKSGNAKFVEFGIGLRQKLDEKKQFANIMGNAPRAAAPASEAYPGYNEKIGMAAPTNVLAPAAAPAAAPVNAMAPAAAPGTNALADVAMLRQKRDALLSMGTPQAIAAARALDSDIQLASKAPVYHNVPGVGLVNPITKEVLVPSKAAPAAPPVSVAEFERAKTDPAFMKFLRERAAAGRAPAQPVAPTITSIVDPLNPNQMITVDARRYQGGGAGSPGVIGVAGKEPGAALRQNKVEAGKTQLADDLDNLRASFEALDRMRSIPSTERNALSNVASGIAATGIGQKTGQLFGTEAQVERDVINSARTRLVNSIKNATGMSAQQLNSNVELQTMLKSISDPGQSVQAAMRIIGDIEDAYVKGDGKMLKRGAPAAAGAAPAPNIDALLNKYK